MVALLELLPDPVDDDSPVVPGGKVVTLVEFDPNPTWSGSERHPDARTAHAAKALSGTAQV